MLLITYKEALEVLKQYNDWRENKPNVKMPSHKKITSAINCSITMLETIIKEQSISHPSRIALENIYRICRKELEKQI